jgi:hypothetical protein
VLEYVWEAGAENVPGERAELCEKSHTGGAFLESHAFGAEDFKEASRTDDYWSKKWWQQAEYIARVLERLGDELQANGEAIELVLRDIKHGRRAS